MTVNQEKGEIPINEKNENPSTNIDDGGNGVGSNSEVSTPESETMISSLQKEPETKQITSTLKANITESSSNSSEYYWLIAV